MAERYFPVNVLFHHNLSGSQFSKTLVEAKYFEYRKNCLFLKVFNFRNNVACRK